jgi:diguanylate cyclase (GGDEF)-like protein
MEDRLMALMKTVERAEFVALVDRKVNGGALALASLDLDHFASLNTAHGKETGDLALAALERTLTGSLPKEAVVSRLGGDEYAVALPDQTAETALIVFDEIRTHCADHAFAPDLPAVRLEVSVGIASRPPHATGTAELLRASDEALGRAKRDGRSRVAIYIEEKMTLKSNYYSRATLDRLGKLSAHTGRTEASLLREGLDDLLAKYRDES